MNYVYYESIKKIIIENSMNNKKRMNERMKKKEKKKNEYSTTKLKHSEWVFRWNFSLIVKKIIISMQKRVCHEP